MNRKFPCPRRLTLLHADTPGVADEFDLPLASRSLALRLTSLPFPDGFRAVSAIWSREGRTDGECRERLFRTVLSFRRKCAAAGIAPERVPLSVEDLRLIGRDLSVLDAIAAAGIVSVIPFWRGENALGGAWDTDAGLTDFGRAAIDRCFDLGLIPDLSHASRSSADEMLAAGARRGRPVIASHVGFDAILPHGRNLTDRQAESVASLGGLIGITFHAPHLSKKPRASVADVTAHVLYGFARFPDAIALGSDFDGTDALPEGLSSSDDLPALAGSLSDAGLSNEEIDRIFFQNADRFFDAVGHTERF